MDLERGEQELGRHNLSDRDVAIREAAHYAAEFKASKKTPLASVEERVTFFVTGMN